MCPPGSRQNRLVQGVQVLDLAEQGPNLLAPNNNRSDTYRIWRLLQLDDCFGHGPSGTNWYLLQEICERHLTVVNFLSKRRRCPNFQRLPAGWLIAPWRVSSDPTVRNASINPPFVCFESMTICGRTLSNPKIISEHFSQMARVEPLLPVQVCFVFNVSKCTQVNPRIAIPRKWSMFFYSSIWISMRGNRDGWVHEIKGWKSGQTCNDTDPPAKTIVPNV